MVRATSTLDFWLTAYLEFRYSLEMLTQAADITRRPLFINQLHGTSTAPQILLSSKAVAMVQLEGAMGHHCIHSEYPVAIRPP
jgi:hypothetical protein